jgi:hypothetical protein
VSDGDETEPELPDRQRAHIRRRDRKRETRMVVDNAGVRRIARAVQERERTKPKPKPDAAEG